MKEYACIKEREGDTKHTPLVVWWMLTEMELSYFTCFMEGGEMKLRNSHVTHVTLKIGSNM